MSDGSIKRLAVPSLRGVEPSLRRRRLLAARSYAVHAIPRHAILLGHWDRGSIIGSAGQEVEVGNEG